MLQWSRVIVLGIMVWLSALGPVQFAHGATESEAAHAQSAALLRAPAEIPEPVTVILFGTGLAAMAAAATVKRRK